MIVPCPCRWASSCRWVAAGAGGKLQRLFGGVNAPRFSQRAIARPDMFFASFYEISEAASSWRSTKASNLSPGNAANFPRLVGEVFVDTNLGEGDNPVFMGRPASGSPTACCRQSPIRRVGVLETWVTPPMSSRNFPRACNPRITGTQPRFRFTISAMRFSVISTTSVSSNN